MAIATIPQRSFKAYAVVEALRNGSEDIRGALVPFFHPPLAFLNAQIFDPDVVAHAINEAYAWNITRDIVEEFVPAFVEHGWLAEIERTDQKAIYRITCALPDGTFHSNLNEELKELGSGFRRFIEELSPLSAVNLSEDELLEILIQWLSSLDILSGSNLRQRVRTTSSALAAKDQASPEEGPLTADQHYLCARFTDALFEVDSPLTATLIEITKIGLITETVQDFAKPITSVNRTKLAVYLDAPVAMDLLSVSGTAARESISPVIDRLVKIGASIRIFDDSVEELQHNLHALFKRPVPLRTGPTATALKKGQVLEAYVREVAARPERALQAIGVQIVSRRLDQFPNDHKHFTENQYRDIYSAINWHIEDQPRNHDATVVTNIMRMRQGRNANDIFEAGHLLVTRNGGLAGAARRLAISAGALDSTSVGPVIHQRQMATAVWLRAGLGSLGDNGVPKRYLLASCERVLQLRPDVVEKVRQQAKARSPETAEQLDLLLSSDRSTQMLMDKTLNVSWVITEDNLEFLLDEMKTSLIAKNVAETKAEIKKVRAQASADYNLLERASEAQLQTVAEARSRSEAEAAEALARIEELRTEDEQAIGQLLASTNATLEARAKVRKRTIVGVGIGADVLAVVLAFIYDSPTLLILAIFILLGVAGHILGWVEKLWESKAAKEENARTLLWQQADKWGLRTKLERAQITYNLDQFSVS